MDVVLVITSLKGGGAERVVINLARHWSALGYRVGIVTLFSIHHDAYEIPPNVKRVGLNLGEPSGGMLRGLIANLERIRALRKTLKKLAPLVAISFLTETNVLTALASSGLSHRVVVSERVHPPRHLIPFHWNLLRRWTYRRCDLVVVQTQLTADWLHEHIRCKRLIIIPNAVSWPLETACPVVDVKNFVEVDERLLLAAGRLSDQKGFDRLIKVFGQVADEFSDWRLVIAGDDVPESPRLAKLQQQITALKLDSRVALAGRVGNMDDWYKRCDLFVLSSRYEGFPNVLLEAMSAGCSVVSVDCETGPSDIIEDGENGFLADNTDDALKDALRAAMNDESMRRLFANQATAVQTRFGVERIMQLWHEAAALPRAPQ